MNVIENATGENSGAETEADDESEPDAMSARSEEADETAEPEPEVWESEPEVSEPDVSEPEVSEPEVSEPETEVTMEASCAVEDILFDEDDDESQLKNETSNNVSRPSYVSRSGIPRPFDSTLRLATQQLRSSMVDRRSSSSRVSRYRPGPSSLRH